MTRKRYIKLLMSVGVGRNAAAEMAADCRKAGASFHVGLYTALTSVYAARLFAVPLDVVRRSADDFSMFGGDADV